MVARVRPSGENRTLDRALDVVVRGLCVLAAVIAAATIAGIAYEVVHGADGAISRFGLAFVGHTAWRPNFGVFGAAVPLFGTAVSSLTALVIALPMGIAIGLYLSLLAPRRVRSVVGPLVEGLAAVPSVILGLWGILVLGPFLRDHVEPWLHGNLGFIPLFGSPSSTGSSMFTAALVLVIMVLPIIASISRDLFLTVPTDLQEGATALGATRWEVVRGIVLPSAFSGIVAAAFLGLGRALGEAIAVSQVIGAGNSISRSLFDVGDTLAARVANQFQNPFDKLHQSSLFYLATILLAIGLLTNLLAQWIARRFDVRYGVAR